MQDAGERLGIDRAAVQALYDANRFVDAYGLTRPYWSRPDAVRSLEVEDLVLAGRLAARLGSGKLSRALFREARRRAPEHPQVRYFARHAGRLGLDLLSLLREGEAVTEAIPGDPAMDASWLASQAELWACVRDFGEAHRCLALAEDRRVERAWISACRSNVLRLEDKWEAALEAAETSWRMSSGAPFAASSLGAALARLGKLEEVASRLGSAAETGQSVETSMIAVWYLCALAEREAGAGRRRWADRARALAERLTGQAPLADRATTWSIARARIDAAQQQDDWVAVERFAREIPLPFYRAILANRERNPAGRRVILPHARTVQTHQACLPASVAAVAAAYGAQWDGARLASEMTFGGTPMWAACEWLVKQGWTARPFLYGADTARRLLKAGHPFVVALEAEDSAHAVAAVGLDEAAGLLIVHDPADLRLGEWLIDHVSDDQSPLGADCLALAPPARAAEMDALVPPEESAPAAALNRHRRASDLVGLSAERPIVHEEAAARPAHPVTRYLQARVQISAGQPGRALPALQSMTREHPDCLRLRRALMEASRAVDNTTLLRDQLKDIVERGLRPGIDAERHWRHPPVTYLCQYADTLRQSASGWPRARRLLGEAIRRAPACAEAYHDLGDLELSASRTAESLLPLRLAACIEPASDHYARTHSDALRMAGREAGGLAALEQRARALGARPRSAGVWVTWIEALEEYGWPAEALEALAEAERRQGEDPALLGFGISLRLRLGEHERAKQDVERLRHTTHRAHYIEAAVSLHQSAGDIAAALELCRQWVEEAPRAMAVRRRLLDLVAARDGHAAALEQARAWCAAQPGHEGLEYLCHQELQRAGFEDEDTRLLDRRVGRNPDDGWAWRERAILEIDHLERAPPSAVAAGAEGWAKILDECRRTGPRAPATLYVEARALELQGRLPDAIETVFQALDVDPSAMSAYRTAWRMAAGRPEAEQRRTLGRLESHLLRINGPLHPARELAFGVAARLGTAEAEVMVERLAAARPADPEVIEARADLLLEYGQGRSDAARVASFAETAVRRFPLHNDLRLSLAHAYRLLGREADALAVWEEAGWRYPATPFIAVQRALALERAGRIADARAALQQATERAPDAMEGWTAYAGFLERQGETEAAAAVLRRALALMPGIDALWEALIDLLGRAGRPEESWEAAREAAAAMPECAYRWHLVAQAGERCPARAPAPDIEQAWRRALSLHARLFVAADGFAVWLTGRRRFDEALGVVRAIRPLLADPSPATGREAWILREKGETGAALTAMEQALGAAPWYAWGWYTLLEWMETSRDDGVVLRLFKECPPALAHHPEFRTRRLALCAAVQPRPEGIDEEWSRLLADFPDHVPLHLRRSDALWDDRREQECGMVLDLIRKRAPEDPYILVRQLRQMGAGGEYEAMAALAMDVWSHCGDGDRWPAAEVFSLFRRRNAMWADLLARRLRSAMEQGGRFAVAVIEALTAYYAGLEPRRGRADWVARRVPGPGGRGLRRLLRVLDATAWADGRHRAAVFHRLDDLGYQDLAVRYWRRHPERCEPWVESWQQIGHALLAVNRRKARVYLAGWADRAGVSMWIACNHVLSIRGRHPGDLIEIRDAATRALERLPHDHTARFLSVHAATALLRLGEHDGFLRFFDRHKSFWESKYTTYEYMNAETALLADILPGFAALLRSIRPEERREWTRKIARHWVPGSLDWIRRSWNHMVCESAKDEELRRLRWTWWRAALTGLLIGR